MSTSARASSNRAGEGASTARAASSVSARSEAGPTTALTRSAERPRAPHLLGRQHASLLVATELDQRQRGRRPPGDERRVLAAEDRMILLAALQLLEGRLVVPGGGAEQAGAVAHQRASHERGVVANAGVVDQAP